LGDYFGAAAVLLEHSVIEQRMARKLCVRSVRPNRKTACQQISVLVEIQLSMHASVTCPKIRKII